MFFAYFSVVHRVGLFKTMKSVFCFVLWYLLEFPEHFKERLTAPRHTPTTCLKDHIKVYSL